MDTDLQVKIIANRLGFELYKNSRRTTVDNEGIETVTLSKAETVMVQRIARRIVEDLEAHRKDLENGKN